MKYSMIVLAMIAGIVATSSWAVGAVATDTLTKLPVPASLHLDEAPMRLTDVPVCKSKAQMNFYTPGGGKVDAAVAWYSANLNGFQHTHGYGSGRSQDTFFNAAGTVVVSISGGPAADGQNVDVYSIIYGTISPGVSEKAIIGMNVQKAVCP